LKGATPGFLTLGPALNRTQELARKLSDEIRSGRLEPGSRLPTEQELSAATGVSRTVVREAVAALRADGLVVTRQGLGAFVAADLRQRPFRIDSHELQSGLDVVQILELRMSLEIEASGLAAERRSEADLAKIAAALRMIGDEIERGRNAVDADFQFHLAIFAAARNPHFPRFLEFLGPFIIPRLRIRFSGQDDSHGKRYLRRIQVEHTAMYAAIRDGNATVARTAARRHLSNALRRYQEVGAPVASGADAAPVQRTE